MTLYSIIWEMKDERANDSSGHCQNARYYIVIKFHEIFGLLIEYYQLQQSLQTVYVWLKLSPSARYF